MSETHSVKVIAVGGGKGGVGKTNVSVNLAISLAQLGRRVMLLDADLGLANIDVLLGLKPSKNLADVFDMNCSLRDVIINGPAGIKIIPASSGTQEMMNLKPADHAGLVAAFSEFSDQIDYLIIDTAAGLSDSVCSFVHAAQDVLLVVCNEPTSITDAYAQIKLFNQKYGVFNFHIVANDVRSIQEGKQLFSKLVNVCERFLDAALSYEGYIPHDELLRKSVQQQKSVVEAYPNSKSSQSFGKLADRVDNWPRCFDSKGHLEFFVDQLVVDHSAVGQILQ